MGIKTIVLAGFACGVLDLLCTAILFQVRGVSLEKLLQFIASGALGETAFKYGKKSASLGLAFHFLIALAAAALYYLSSLRFPLFLNHFLLCGLSYGILVQLTMTFIVLPLSRIAKRKFALNAFLQQLVVHMLVVGPSISVVVHNFS